MYEDCRNCGYPEGLHHYQTRQCPHGGEAPVGKRQEWKASVFVPNNEPDIERLAARIEALEARIEKLER